MKILSDGIHIFSRPFMLGLLGYIGMVLVLFWPVLFPPKNMLIYGDDIHRSYHFFRIFERNELSKGTMPWWNPYQFSGEPFVANPSITFWYPPNWLFLFMEYRYAYAIIIPLHILLAMIGMYWLSRRFMGQMAAWGTGLIFGLSGFFMGRVWQGHIDILTSAPYLPIVFGCMWRALEKKTLRRIVLAGAVYAVQMYAGYQTMAYFTGWALLILVILWSLKEKSLRPFIIFITIVLITAGLAALQILPAQEFFQHSIRTYTMPYSWVVMGSYTLKNVLQLVSPFTLGEPYHYKGPGPNYGELAAYMGVISLILASMYVIIFIIRKLRFFRRSECTQKDTLTLSCILLGIFGLWISFGWNAPIDLQYILWKIIPLYQYLRIPSRHLILFVFSASILAGLGFDIVKKRSLRFILITCIVVDLVLFVRHFIVLRPDPGIRHNRELVSFLQKNSGLTRVLPNFNVGMGTRDALDFDAAMAYEFYSATGYDPAILRNYYDFIVAANGLKEYDVQQSDVQIPVLNPLSKYVDFLNIKYILVPTWLDTVGEAGRKYKAVIEDTKKDYWRLYENTSAGPRFSLVPHLALYQNRDELTNAIINIAHNPLTTVSTSDKETSKSIGRDCELNSRGEVNVTRYESNKIVLTTSALCSMYLSSSEVYYPGWHATVDGANAHIFESNLAFRALAVPAGKHTVVMEYRPTIFIIGGSISMGTLLLCLYACTRKKRNES